MTLLENYFNENEVRKSVFYRILTKSNFEFNKRGISSTNIDMRLALNNLKIVCKINENFEFENSDCVVYDSKKAFLKKIDVYNRNYFMMKKIKIYSILINIHFFGENGTTIDYQYFANFEEQIKFNDKNTLGNYSTIKNNYTMLRKILTETIDLLFKNKSESLISTNNIYGNDEQLTIDYYFKSLSETQIVFNDKNTINNHTEIKNNYTMLKKIN